MNEIVVKRNDLIQSYTTALNYNQQKILVALLSKYVLNTDNRSECFDSGELLISDLAKLMGLSTGGSERNLIKKELSNMIEKSFLISVDGDNFKKTMIFDEIEYNSDKKVVVFSWSNKIKPYISNIDGNITPFTKYLSSTYLRLKSKKSQNLYEVLKSYQNLKVVTITIEKLKFITSCQTKAYDSYMVFNRNVIKKCISEINELTDIAVEYTPIKKGRITNSIRFSIKGINSDVEKKEKYGKFENIYLTKDEYLIIKDEDESLIDQLSTWKNERNIVKRTNDFLLLKKWDNGYGDNKTYYELPEYKSDTPTLTPEELEELKQWLKEGKEKGI